MAEIDQNKKEADDFGKNLELWKPRLSAYLPTQIKPDRVISLALHAVTKSQGLLECKRQSVIAGVVAAMQVGLELHTPLNHAYLIPFNDKKRGKIAQLVIGYPGYIDLMHRSGKVEMIDCRVVYQGDHFEYALGTNCYIEHRPGPVEDRESVTFFYAIVWLKGSQRPLVEVMPAEDVNAIRDRSASYRAAEKYHKHDSPWHTDYEIMGRKTVLKRIQKWAPKSADMAMAIEIDNAAEAGKEQFNHIDLGDIEPETEDGDNGGGRTKKLKDKLTNGPKANSSAASPVDDQAPPEDGQAPPDEPSPESPEAGPESGEAGEEEKKTDELIAFRNVVITRDGKCVNPHCPNQNKQTKNWVPAEHLEAHHIKPRGQGGGNDPSNGMALCQGDCHVKATQGYTDGKGTLITAYGFVFRLLNALAGGKAWEAANWDESYAWLERVVSKKRD